jgi:hypothetical protein
MPPLKPARVKRDVVATTNAAYTLSSVVLPWMLCYGAGTARAFIELQKTTSANLRVKLRYRYAAVRTDRPQAWVDSDTYRSGDGANVEDVTLSGSYMWVQIALATATASSGQAGEGFAELAATTNNKGAVVAATSVQVEPTPSGAVAVFPIGKPFPALGLAGVAAAFDVTGVAGTLNYGLVIRYFTGDESEPGDWNDVVSYTGVTASELVNTGDQTGITPSTNLLAQLGVKAGGTNPRATLRVVGAARWS